MQVQSVAANRTIGTIVYAVCAASTASAEYDLAVACGFGGMAWCLPAALDAYVLVALRERRDTALAVIVLLAVVATSHLVSGGFLEVSAAVVIGISSVAPLILWRVHSLLWGHRDEDPALVVLQPPLEDHQPQVSDVIEDQTDLHLQPPVEPLQEELEVETIDQETLVEKLVADGEPLPGRGTVMKLYNVSEWTAKQALREAKRRLQEDRQNLQEAVRR